MSIFLVTGIILILIYLTAMFLTVQLKKDSYIGNFTWGIGCVIITLYTFFLKDIHLARHILITLLVTLWGIRLGTFFYLRYHKGVNPKFLEWQRSWGKYALLISLGWIFIAQATLMIIMSAPSIVINFSSIPGLNALDIFAVITWTIGFLFESIGDYQLYNFMKSAHDKDNILNKGLWYYSRHPNYFGEMVMWWSIFLIALSVPYGIYTIIAPLTITIMLRFFTGVPKNEKQLENNINYRKYQETTSMLIPLPKFSSK